MLDIMEEWVGTGCGDCCFVERSTLAKYGKIEADFSAIDPEVEEQEPCRSFEHLIMEDCSKWRRLNRRWASHEQGREWSDHIIEGWSLAQICDITVAFNRIDEHRRGSTCLLPKLCGLPIRELEAVPEFNGFNTASTIFPTTCYLHPTFWVEQAAKVSDSWNWHYARQVRRPIKSERERWGATALRVVYHRLASRTRPAQSTPCSIGPEEIDGDNYVFLSRYLGFANCEGPVAGQWRVNIPTSSEEHIVLQPFGQPHNHPAWKVSNRVGCVNMAIFLTIKRPASEPASLVDGVGSEANAAKSSRPFLCWSVQVLKE